MKVLQPIYLFPLVIASLILGIAGGWIRLGYLEYNVTGSAANHGLLMVGGFLGTLISLERAMVMKHKAWLLVPMLSGMSIPVLLFLGKPVLGNGLLFSASVGLIAIMYLQSVRHQEIYQFIMSVGAISWMLGNFMILYTDFIASAVPWWVGFILFTIVGERLELSKFLPTPKIAKNALIWLLALFFLGMWTPFHGIGNWLMGTSVIFISFWLLHYDMAKIASKKENQFKYIGIGLRVGYVWLTLHGIILCFMENHPLYYDLFVHTFFLGFTFSMIWAHAPIILPMVLNIKHNPYHPILWIGWAVFQISLLGRVLSSIVFNPDLRLWFGVINGWTILLMFGLMVIIIIHKIKRDYSLKRKSSVQEFV
ncbi:hypothetical protein [Shivajiella indica]|uniref:NnrS family protein n=1 Tax=Shivajiella indica TaxID=872115 RepID=A0ABW5B6H8_9BACT